MSRLTPRPCPLWSAATLSSIDAFLDRLALLRRSTWNVAHSSPTLFSLGRIPLFQTLSRRNGVPRSVGNKSACGSASVRVARHSPSSINVPGDRPTTRDVRLPLRPLGVSKIPLVDPLIDENRVVRNIAESDRENLAWPHSVEDGHPEDQAFAGVKHPQSLADLFWGGRARRVRERNRDRERWRAGTPRCRGSTSRTGRMEWLRRGSPQKSGKVSGAQFMVASSQRSWTRPCRRRSSPVTGRLSLSI